METNDTVLDNLIDQTERLGVIGSPSSTGELALDILGSAVSRKLVGELALFRYLQDIKSHYALGQITEVQLKNIWHEDPTMRSLIRQRGRVDAVSERQDTHLAKMVLSAVFQEGGTRGYEPSILGTVPSTGTLVHQVDDFILGEILKPYKDQIFYLGHVYGSKPKLPLWFKHFGKGATGAGEAYHLGIFGKTGSGKSVLAKMILLAYTRNPKMATLIIDPQGEFGKDLGKNQDQNGFNIPLREIISKQGKEIFVLTIRNLVLDRWDLFKQILVESKFFRELQVMTRDKVELASDQFGEALKKASGIKLANLHLKETFDKAWDILSKDKIRNKIYAKEGAAAERFKDALLEANSDEIYSEVWLPIARLFHEDRKHGKRKVEDALNWLLDLEKANRPVLVVDVSKEQAEGLLWNDNIQSLVIKRLLEGVTNTAESMYKEGENLNALIVIDEAHRLAPREYIRDNDIAREVKTILIDAARTTRKYGLGWLFISQTLSSLHSEIIQQLRIFFFGFGLGLGQEFQSLRQLVGSSDTSLDLYQSFRDPHSAFDTRSRQYSWMTIGPVSPLSFSGTPLFFNAFNTIDAFTASNSFLRNENS
jgi:hypothetical protein